MKYLFYYFNIITKKRKCHDNCSEGCSGEDSNCLLYPKIDSGKVIIGKVFS